MTMKIADLEGSLEILKGFFLHSDSAYIYL